MPHVLLLPGLRYGPSAPLLAYATEVITRRGGSARSHTWGAEVPGVDSPAVESWVAEQVAAALAGLPANGGGPPLVIGKSLGNRLPGRH